MSSEIVDASLVAAIAAALLVPIARGRAEHDRLEGFGPFPADAAMLAKDSPSDPGPRTVAIGLAAVTLEAISGSPA